MPSARRLLACLCAAAVLTAAPARAQTAENVAVVINDNSPESQRVGEYYVGKRTIPQANVIRIKTAVAETVSRQVYAGSIEAPIAAALLRGGLQDRVLYIVVTKGVPLRIEGTTGQTGSMASVDSELALLYRRMVGASVPTVGRVDNPYFASRETAFAPFTRRDFDIYLVSRLDGFTVEDALALVDRGSSPVREGRIVLDQQARLVNRTGEDWLEAAAERLRTGGHGERVLLETTPEGVRGVKPVLGYYSWGSTDPRNRTRSFEFGFAPGALAAMFVSGDARTFKEPPSSWVPTGEANKAAWHEGAPHSLIGDLIREGVTGVAGHVGEPFLQSAIRPEVLFPAYLEGATLAEAFYRAMPHLGWQAIVIGDPLCAPFRERPIGGSAIDGGTDSTTLLPAHFSRRRVMQVLSESPGATEEAVALAVRGETLMRSGDAAAAKQAFERATALSPQIPSAQLQLAMMHEQAGEAEAAIERYRIVVAAQPLSVIALNNLAYRLAVDGKRPTEALGFAQRAVKLAPQNPNVLDTLAWTQHLLGDAKAAVRTMAAALKLGPNHAEIRLHAAIIYAAAGARAVAEDNLSEALRLDPGLAMRPEVKQLRSDLKVDSVH